MHIPSRRRIALTLLTFAMLVIAAGTCRCVYFNVFYNAKSAFDTAYKSHMVLLKNNPDSVITTLPSDILANYDRAIDKASKVLDEFPKAKKWHDDALFLIAKASYYKGDYEKTIRVCNELFIDFPSSPFVPEAYLFLGKANLEFGNLDRADAAFTTILEKYPYLNSRQEITLLVAETAARKEGKKKALTLMEQSSLTIKEPEKKLEIIIKTVHLAMELNQYAKALALMENCPRDKKFIKQLYRIDYFRVSCYEELDSLDKALNLVQTMLKGRKYQIHSPELLLKKAEILMNMGKTADAVAIYESVIAVDSTKDVAGVAYYQLGCWQQGLTHFEKAKLFFSKASSIAADSIMKSDAGARVKVIDSLTMLYGVKDSLGTDTAKKIVEHLRKADEKIGDLYWLELNKPDSAYHYYKKLAQIADSIQPRILFAATYLAWNAVRDTAGGDSLLQIMLHRYPNNIFTQQAQMGRGVDVTVKTRLDSAHTAYLMAETLYYDKHEPEKAVGAFQAVYQKYPESEFGVKGLYTAAWINDNVLGNNKAAFRLYRMICDSFPTSEICSTQVKPLLKIVSDSIAVRKARKAAATAAAAAKAAALTAALAGTAAHKDRTATQSDSAKNKPFTSKEQKPDTGAGGKRLNSQQPADTMVSHTGPPTTPDSVQHINAAVPAIVQDHRQKEAPEQSAAAADSSVILHNSAVTASKETHAVDSASSPAQSKPAHSEQDTAKVR